MSAVTDGTRRMWPVRLATVPTFLMMLLGTGFAEVTAQETPTLSPAAVSTAIPVGALVRPEATLMTVALGVSIGSSADPIGSEGAMSLLAESLARTAEMAARALAFTRVQAEVTRSRTTFTLLVAPESWAEVYPVVHDILFRTGPSETEVERARDAALERLVFESGAPVREFESELYRFLAPNHPRWSSEPEGTVESLASVPVAMLETLRRNEYGSAPSAISAVGPVQVDSVRRVVASIGGSPRPAPTASPSETLEGHRTELRNVTNSWVAVSIPLPESADPVTTRFLVHLFRERLNPDTPEPGIYWIDAHVESTPNGPVLLVVGASFPERATDLERSVLETLESVRSGPLDPTLFLRWKRRLRTAFWLERATPETAATLRLHDMENGVSMDDFDRRLRTLDPETVHAFAMELEAPRVLVFGPDLAGEGSGEASLDAVARR